MPQCRSVLDGAGPRSDTAPDEVSSYGGETAESVLVHGGRECGWFHHKGPTAAEDTNRSRRREAKICCMG